MKTLKQYFEDAVADRWAIGHFNFSTGDQLRAIVEAAAELKSPVMVATSEGEAEFIGYNQAAALVRSYQQGGHAVFLNADHHRSWEKIELAMNAGYDTFLIDASKMSYDENTSLTKEVVAKVKFYNKRIEINSLNPYLLVEGELGYLRGSSEIQESVEIRPSDYTQPEQATDFVSQTGVDRLAVVFGNIHGIVTKQEEHLDIEHLKKIVQAVPDTPLVLHGGSGLPAEEIKLAIQNGIANVHINTELRVAYHDELQKQLEKEPKQTTPYKYLEPAVEEVKKMVKAKLELFGSVGKK